MNDGKIERMIPSNYNKYLIINIFQSKVLIVIYKKYYKQVGKINYEESVDEMDCTDNFLIFVSNIKG
jgi:hypothetical protein